MFIKVWDPETLKSSQLPHLQRTPHLKNFHYELCSLMIIWLEGFLSTRVGRGSVDVLAGVLLQRDTTVNRAILVNSFASQRPKQ